jgi:hypothetical protein
MPKRGRNPRRQPDLERPHSLKKPEGFIGFSEELFLDTYERFVSCSD